MATFEITGPDGNKYQVSGETAEGALKALQQHLGPDQSQSLQPRSWSDVPAEALQNIPASAKQFASDIIQPVLHPVDTIESLATLGSGAVNKLFPQLAGLDKWAAGKGLKEASDPNAVAEQEQLASGVGKFFKDRYGSTEGLKKTLATDPVGAAGDIATIFAGGGAGLARLPGKAASVSSKVLRTAGNAVNPVNAVTMPGGRLLKRPAAEILGLSTGAGGDSIMEAFKAGERGGSYGKAFRDNMRGLESQEAVLQDAHTALDKMARDRSAQYRRSMSATKANRSTIDYAPIENSMQDLVDSLHHGPSAVTDNASLGLAKKVGEAIDEWRNNFPNPTATDLDRLKVKIDKLKPNWSQQSGDQPRIVTTMRNAVKDEIMKKDPAYADTMKAYEESINAQTEIERALSLGDKASKDTSLRKLQSVLRNNVNSNYGSRRGNVKALEDAGADNIMPKLAGQALNSVMPRGLQQLVMGLLAGGGAGASIATGGIAPLMALAALPAASPRLVAEVISALGGGKRKIPNAPLAAFQAGRDKGSR